MIDFIVQIVMSMILLIGGVIIGVSLIRMHRDRNLPNLMDLLTTRKKVGNEWKVFLDARKCFEAGAFLTSTWAFVFLTASNKLTEFFFIGYMGAWVSARFLRDREQRLGAAK